MNAYTVEFSDLDQKANGERPKNNGQPWKRNWRVIVVASDFDSAFVEIKTHHPTAEIHKLYLTQSLYGPDHAVYIEGRGRVDAVQDGSHSEH